MYKVTMYKVQTMYKVTMYKVQRKLIMKTKSNGCTK